MIKNTRTSPIALFVLLGTLSLSFAQVERDYRADLALGDLCLSTEYEAMSHTTCNNTICTCSYGTVPDSNGTKCYQASIGYGTFCEISPQCRFSLGDGSICEDSMCSCQSDFLYKDDKCKFKIGELGAKCASDKSVCYLEGNGDQQHSWCAFTCACQAGYKSSADNLTCVGEAGSYCESPNLCTEHATCLKGRCECDEMYAEVDNECKNATECLGDPCENNAQCTMLLGANAECNTNHVCSCMKGTAAKNKKCLFKRDLVGTQCYANENVCYLEADDSSENVDCINEKCTCNEGYTANGHKTKCIADLGSKCLDEITCTSNGKCINSVCECGTAMVDNECMKVAESLAGPCTINEQCSLPFSNYSFCDSSVCSCDKYSAPKDNKCLEKKDLVGTRCKLGQHVCYLEADETDENVECVDLRCACKAGYKMSADRKKCIADLGSRCSNKINCTNNAECSQSVCKCNAGYIQIGSECMKAAESLGDGCREEAQCSLLLGGNTVCENSVCCCAPGTAAKDNKCLAKKDLVGTQCDANGNVCYLEADDSSENVECINKKCTCNEGYTANGNKTKCIAGLGTRCMDQVTCTHNTRCYDGICICSNGTTEFNNECVRVLDLGAVCSATSPPCIENAECVDYICQCKENLEPVEDICKEGAATQQFVSLVCLLVAVTCSVVL